VVILASNKQLFGVGQTGPEEHTTGAFLCGHETLQRSDLFINGKALDACDKLKTRRKEILFFVITKTILSKVKQKITRDFLIFF